MCLMKWNYFTSAIWWAMRLQDNAACVLTKKLHQCVQHRQAFAKWEQVDVGVDATESKQSVW